MIVLGAAISLIGAFAPRSAKSKRRSVPAAAETNGRHLLDLSLLRRHAGIMTWRAG
jgi:hypothetical protein